uniref:Uncharacterized protein n=1 Tax=viral metagenome TaxID=1070528 RepID=A0A6C0D6I6_9ZZZZ
MTILFSLPVGRSKESAFLRTLNILEYVEDSIVMLNLDVSIPRDYIEENLKIYMNKRVFITMIPRMTRKDGAQYNSVHLHSHISNYKYAKSLNLKFHTIYFVSDSDMFFRKGLYSFIKNYDAGFQVCQNRLKPSNYKEIDFMEGQFVNQVKDSYYMDGLLSDPKITRVGSEQMEGEFYKETLFAKMLDYIDNLAVHYSEAISNVEEATFSTVYFNIFMKDYPVYLPISTIIRDDDLIRDNQRLFNIITRQKEEVSLYKPSTYPALHTFTFGFKRVKYNESQHLIVNDLIKLAKQFLTHYGIPNEEL